MENSKLDKIKKLINITTIIFVAIYLIMTILHCFIFPAQAKERNIAMKNKLTPIMTSYDINSFSVEYIKDGINDLCIYTDEFEQLTKTEALALLMELSQISSFPDPCGGKNIGISSNPRPENICIYPSANSDYYYYILSTRMTDEIPIFKKYKPGLYRSDSSICILSLEY